MREDREKLRKAKRIKFFIRLGAVLTVVLLLVFFAKAPMFNVTSYEVEGNSYYTADEIRTMADCKVGENIFIGTDYKDMKERLSRDPYFKTVKFSVSLPSTVTIRLEERDQAMAFVYGENYIVVSSDTTVLRKTSVDPKIPVIRGINLTELSIGSTLGVEDELFLTEAVDIIKAMNENDMYFKEIYIEKNQVTCYILDNLKVEGKTANIIEVLESGDLHSVVEELFSREIERGVITVSGEKYISYSPKL